MGIMPMGCICIIPMWPAPTAAACAAASRLFCSAASASASSRAPGEKASPRGGAPFAERPLDATAPAPSGAASAAGEKPVYVRPPVAPWRCFGTGAAAAGVWATSFLTPFAAAGEAATSSAAWRRARMAGVHSASAGGGGSWMGLPSATCLNTLVSCSCKWQGGCAKARASSQHGGGEAEEQRPLCARAPGARLFDAQKAEARLVDPPLGVLLV